MIEVERLTKRYGEIVAVRDISFSVAKGEIVGFLGPNGAGKTTTMRVLTCFLSPTEGCARVGGHDVFEAAHEVKKVIGYLPEHPPVYGDMRVAEYLRFVARIKGVPAARVRSAVGSAMEKAGVAHRERQLIRSLSKG